MGLFLLLRAPIAHFDKIGEQRCDGGHVVRPHNDAVLESVFQRHPPSIAHDV
jgi:hypothetical protein